MLKGTPIKQYSESRYLGILLQSDLTFSNHIRASITKAMKVLGLIKRSLYAASKKNRLLAYTTLCRPILEYGSSLWDPHSKSLVYDIGMVQNRAIRFICGLKGRKDSISEARKSLGLCQLSDRRLNNRLKLLLRMMDDSHPSLSDFVECEANPNPHSHQTRAQTSHLLHSLPCNSNIYFQSFLPRTIRDLRGEAAPDG